MLMCGLGNIRKYVQQNNKEALGCVKMNIYEKLMCLAYGGSENSKPESNYEKLM